MQTIEPIPRVAEVVIQPRHLRLGEIPLLTELGHIEEDMLVFDRGLRGTRLRTRPKVRLGRVLSLSQKGLVEYIIRSLIRERPRLLPWAFENLSVIEVARYLLR